MFWKFCVWCTLVIILVAICSEKALSVVPPKIEYKINVSLSVKQKLLYGEEEISYTSGVDVPLHELYLHLYPNAFRGRESTGGQEAEKKMQDYTLAHSKKKDLGHIRIDSLKVNGNPPEFKVDDTIMKINLSNPLMPGETAIIKIYSLVKIPKTIFRFGYVDKHFTIAQWYPKMVVYDEKGWHPDQYHLIGEFYGDFATFDVSITLPQNYYVGSTGYLVESLNGDNNIPLISEGKHDTKAKKTNSTKTLVFHAERVHDFAWVASPDYVKEETEWNGILVRAVIFKEDSRRKWKNLLSYSLDAIKFYSEQIGPYPYKNLTVVEAYVSDVGGMEYPTLSMIDPSVNTPFMRGLEFVTAHEICHNWWYGMVANDELNNPWLDEGFTEYFTVRYAEWKHEKGNMADFPGWFPIKIEMPYGRLEEWNYLQYVKSGKDRVVAKPAWMLDDYAMYGAIIYSKGSEILDMLNYIIGDSLFSEFIKSYFSQYKFKHPTIQNVEEVAEQVSGQKLDWFFEEWLYTVKECDYAVGTMSREKTNEGEFVTNVEIKRKGEVIMPVEVEATLKDGKKELKRLFADDKTETLTFHTRSPIRKIKIDPEHRLLEVNRLNNESGLLPPVKLKFGLPSLPEVNSYLIVLSPTIWYNDVDKLKLGAKISGSYLLEDNAISLGASHGTKTKTFNYNLRYSTPLRIMKKSDIRLDLNKDNGMRNLEMKISLGENPLISTIENTIGGSVGLVHYPILRSSIGFSYSDKYDKRYFDEKWFSMGKTSVVSLNNSFIQKSYHGFTRLNLDLSRGLGILDADYAFNRAFLSASQEFRLIRTGELIIFLRGSGGYAEGNPPNQEKFDVALGIPKSTVDPLSSLIYTGGGGVRGYQERAILRKELLALNFELRSEGRFLSLRPSLFFDLGRVKDNSSSECVGSFIYDAGIEFRIMDILYVSFPLWLSKPITGEKEFKFRALVGIYIIM